MVYSSKLKAQSSKLKAQSGKLKAKSGKLKARIVFSFPLLAHRYHPQKIEEKLKKIYPEIMTKIKFQLSVKPSKEEKEKQGKSGFLSVKARWVIERSNSWMERCKSLVKNFERTLTHATTKINLCFVRLMLKRLAIEIINKNGKNYAVIPYEFYQQLIDDAEMLADIQEYDLSKKQSEETFPADIVNRIFILGENHITVYREYRNLTLVELAEKTAIDIDKLEKIENNIHIASQENLDMII
jgi:hypothetical protein